MTMKVKIRNLIIRALKDEFQYICKESNYSQWVMGVVIQEEIKKDRGTYTVRTIIKTSESCYVDGTDVTVIVDINRGAVAIDTDTLEDAPIFHGGTVEASLNWLKEIGEIDYLQLENPFSKVDDEK